nr:MAG TPA: hypothetical protein [Crassvirales sp.]
MLSYSFLSVFLILYHCIRSAYIIILKKDIEHSW